MVGVPQEGVVMLGDHWALVVLVLLVALVLFGPKRLPELGQSVGRALKEFKKASQSVDGEVARVAAIVSPDSSAGQADSASTGENTVPAASGASDQTG
jgi:sec-independent protein translocase protein TatA